MDLKLQQERFRLDVKKYFLSKAVVRQWRGLSGRTMESPIRGCVQEPWRCGTLRDSGHSRDGLGLDLGLLELFSNRDSVIVWKYSPTLGEIDALVRKRQRHLCAGSFILLCGDSLM